MPAPLQRTLTPGVYARGSRWVAVYLEDGRQRRRSAATFREAREIKVRATAREAARRAGPTLHKLDEWRRTVPLPYTEEQWALLAAV
jgi:hypothetical protein